MPATITITREQIHVLAEIDCTVVCNEVHTLASALDFWVLDENSHDNQHRSVIIEQDGTVVSDTVVSDSI